MIMSQRQTPEVSSCSTGALRFVQHRGWVQPYLPQFSSSGLAAQSKPCPHFGGWCPLELHTAAEHPPRRQF